MRKHHYFIVIIALTLQQASSMAQNATGVDLNTDSISSFATAALGNSSRVYTGTEYIGYNPSIRSHAFYGSDSASTGSVYYEGVQYAGLLLKYDLVQDEIVILSRSGSLPIKLLKQKINTFQLGNDLFIKMVSDSTEGTSVSTGYYRVLHEGRVSALAKHRKQVLEARKIDEFSKFVQYDQFYLKKDNLYYRINSNSDLLSVLRDKKDEIRKYQRTNGLSFRKNPAEVIRRSAAYYSQLTR